MTLHRLIVSLMLAWTVVWALLYVSTFPVEGDVAPSQGLSGQQAGPGDASPVPARDTDGPVKRGTDVDTLRHLA
ncbi:hypothetical protein ACS5PN_17370 [Roseateles sp. NT4]|uniref:hypothetical protein n=1 Tax=Roseateles sp. NT4 TaxID=3453715 RepID=UPI003EE9C892